MKYLIILLFLFVGCTPVTTNSAAFKNIQNGLLETNKTMNDIALKVDLIAKKSGLDMPIISDQTAELIKQIQADNAKTYSAFNETLSSLMPLIKSLAPIAGQAVGVPQPITSGVIKVVDALLIGGASAGTVGTASTLWARRKEKKKFGDELKEWEEYDEKLEKQEKKKLTITVRANALTSATSTAEYQANYKLAEKQLIEEGVI